MVHDSLVLYTIKEVSDILKTSEKTVTRIMDSGELKWCQVGGQRRVSKGQVEEYLKNVEKVEK